MNGRELVAALCGQENVIVIRRPFVAWLGHVADALLIDQALYWQDRAGDGEWWHQSDEDVCERLCMTLHSLYQARGRLIALGLMETTRKGIPARIHYQVNVQAVVDGLSEQVGPKGRTSTANPEDKGCESEEPSIDEGGVEGVRQVKATPTSKSNTPLPPTLPAAKPADQDATRLAPARAKGKASRPAAERPRDAAFDAFTSAFPTAAASLAAKFSKLVKGKAAPGDWDAWLRDVREDRAKGYVKAHHACELFLAWLDTRHGSSAADTELEARILRLGAPDNWRDIVYAPGGVRRSPVLALPRMGLEPYTQQGDWPAWYRAFEGVQS